jgi:hypothetical protein
MRGYLLSLAVTILAGLLWAQSARPPDVRPGDAPYTRTKLEWAALELQVMHGHDFGPGKHSSVRFLPENDGRTVNCLLLYDRSVTDEGKKLLHDLTQANADRLAKEKGWDWLRLHIHEIQELDYEGHP